MRYLPKKGRKRKSNVRSSELFVVALKFDCVFLPVTAPESRGDRLPAAAAAAPGHTEPQPVSGTVPGLLTAAGQRERWHLMHKGNRYDTETILQPR